ncbi:MAG: RecQ family ATP-dependent DNA helicase, partial [Bacteroidota bacterium]
MTALTIQEALKHYFGYESFRPMQEDIIQSITSGQDTLVLMPTGGGKSLCYQIPALVTPGLCVVVSPLIALMRDQVESLKANGVSAAYLNSTLPYNEYIEILERVKYADLKLLYISPEKILTPQVREMLSQVKISLIAVDEAHCISTWGHDFRPEYAQLHTLRNQLEKAPIIALTATADKNTRRDIAEKLKLRDPQIFISSFDRPNLSLTVLPGQEKMRKIESFIRLRPRQAGIVYCLSRKGTESLANKLQESGYSAAFYHAGMTNEARMRVQDAFINDQVEIVCAYAPHWSCLHGRRQRNSPTLAVCWRG